MGSHTLTSLVLEYITLISVTILIYKSNRIVTEISVIYSNTKPVSVWDAMAHLK